MKCPNCNTLYDEKKYYFCPHCGNQTKNNVKTISVGRIFLISLLITLWIGIIAVIFIYTKEEFFFDTENSNSTVVGGTIYTPIPESSNQSNNTTTGTSLSSTQIVYNKQYYKQSFKDEKDVYNLIVQDSLAQKSNCPAEIVSIENEIVGNYGIKAANLCEMDVTFAKELRNVINYMYNNYPQAREYLTNITLANVGEDADYMAAFMPIFTFAQSNTRNGYPVGVKTQIILNARYFLNTSKITKAVSYSTNVGYFPKNATRSSTVAHEFGHYLSYVALLNHYNRSKMNFVRTSDADSLYKISEDFNLGNFSYKMINEAYQKYKSSYNSNISFNQFREMISSYAVAKDSNGNYIYDETIAEAFHDCYLNHDNASIASKLIFEVLLSYL